MEIESFIQNINKILEKNSENTIIINNKDLKLFIINIENLFQNDSLSIYLSNDSKQEKNNIRFSPDFIRKIKEEDKICLMKKFILAFCFYFIEVNLGNYYERFNISKAIFNQKNIDFLIIKKINQLFFSKIFNENHIIIISKFLIGIGKSSLDYYLLKDIIKNSNYDNEICNKILKEIFSFINKENIKFENQKFAKILFYIIDNIELNKENKNNIINILLNIYLLNYDKKLFEYLIKSTIYHFEKLGNKASIIKTKNLNIKNSFISLNLKILFLKQLIEKEFDLYSQDEFKLFSGFIFEKESSFLQLENIMEYGKEKGITIIFSFNFLQLTNEKTILLEFNEISKKSYFRIFCENKSLFFSIYQSKKENFIFPKENDLKIEEKITYLLIFSIEKGNPCKIKVILNDKEYDFTLQYGKSFDYPFKSVNSELYICKNTNLYKGYIGTVLLFESYFPKEITQIIMDLKGNYEAILLCNECNSYNIRNDIRFFEQKFSKLSKFKLIEKLKGMISPKSTLIKNDNKCKENYYEINNNKIENRNFLIKGQIGTFLNLSFSIYNFLYYNGLKFLQLNCEYYFQILNSEKIEKDYNIINQNIFDLIQFLTTIITNVNNDFLYFEDCFLFSSDDFPDESFIDLPKENSKIETNELSFLLSSICEIIKLLKGDISSIIEEFSLLISLLYIKENTNFISSILNKIVYFLLDKDLYNEETKKVLPKVYLKIYECLNCSNFDLLQNRIIDKLIENNDSSPEYYRLFDIFLLKIMSYELIEINNYKLTSPKKEIQKNNNKAEQFNFILKKIIIKIKDITISISDLDFVYNILMLLYKNLYDIKVKKEEIKNEISDKKDNGKKDSEKKLNLVCYEDNLFENNKYKGFILSGLKSLQSITNQSQEYTDRIDNLKAIFIQYIQFIEQFENSFFEILIDLQRLDFDEGKQIFINGNKSFLSFFSLLFEQMNFQKFENLIKKGVFKISENKINYNNFSEKFRYLLQLVQNFTNDEILKIHTNNPQILLYMRNNVFSFLMNILSDYSSPNIEESKKEIIKNILHNQRDLLIQYYMNYKIFNDENSKVFYTELISISKILIYYDDKPFIFDLLFKVFIKFQSSTQINKRIIPDIFKILVSDLNSSISNKKDIKEDNISIRNIINLVILFYKIMSRFKNQINDKEYYKEFVQSFFLNSFIFTNNPLLYNPKKYSVGKDNEKYSIELIIEIFIELYLLTGKTNYIDFIKNDVLKHPYYNTSLFYYYDKKFIELENENKGFLSIFFSKNNPETRSPRKLLCLHYYIKFCLYSLNNKKCDTLIKPVYEEIKKVLKEDIKKLLSNKTKLKGIENLINPQKEKDELYKKVFNYFFYEKYNNSKFPNKPKEPEEYIQKKISKEKYQSHYIKYFKCSYEKNGEIKKDDINNIIKLSQNQFLNLREDKTLYKSCYISRSPIHSLDLDEEDPSDDNIFQEEEIDVFISKFESEIIHKSYKKYEEKFIYNFNTMNNRRILCKIIFGEYFKTLLFSNDCFLNLRKNHLKSFYYKQVNNTDCDCYLKFPSKIKNFSSKKNKIKIFLKPDFHFFTKQYFHISHKEINLNFETNELTNNLSLFKNRLKIEFDILNSKKFDAELINIECISQGTIFLTENYFIYKSIASQIEDERQSRTSTSDNSLNKVFSSFENDINFKKEKIIYLRFDQIKKFYVKRYLYRNQACEIYLLNGKNYFFNVLTTQNLKSIQLILGKKNVKVIPNLKEHFNKKKYRKQYYDNNLPTLDYLLYINFYSSRSLNDLNQYYIFPWLTVIDENDSKVKLRNFKYPLSAQSESKRKEIIKKFEDLKNKNKKKFVSHFNSHYSASSFINFYLSRISPYNENIIKLQNGQYDNPNRAFYSIYEILEILINYNDNRELVPEFFYLSESYLNLNYYNFGQRDDDYYINNIIFDNYFNGSGINIINPFEFMVRYRKLLESSEVNQLIHLWIDNIFGVNQLNDKKEDCNLYSKYSYAENMDFNKKLEKYNKKKLSIEDKCSKLKIKIGFILNFGQTPLKLFDDKLKIKKGSFFNYKMNTPPKKNSSDKKIFLCEDNELLSVLDKINNKSIIFFFNNNFNKKLYVLSKESIKGITLTIYNNNLNSKNSENEESKKTTSKKIREINLSYFKNYYKDKYIYNLKNCLSFHKYDEQNLFLITSNHRNNSIIFYSNTIPEHCFILPSYPSSILSISNNNIITGHIDGIIIHWSILLEEKSIKLKYIKKCNVSSEPILSISYYHDNDIILVANNKDSSVNIRNLYNFELISVIYLNTFNYYFRYLIVEQQVNPFNYFVYFISYDSEKFNLHCFTVNGIKICKELENICNTFFIFKNGNILTYSYKEKGFIVCKGEKLNKILFIKKLEIEREVIYFEFDEESNNIYYIYQNNDIQNINYIYLTNEDMELIYKEEYFIETKQDIKKDIWNNDIEDYVNFNDNINKTITSHSEYTQSSSV